MTKTSTFRVEVKEGNPGERCRVERRFYPAIFPPVIGTGAPVVAG